MDRVTIKNDVLRKYFPKSYTPKQVEDTILKLWKSGKRTPAQSGTLTIWHQSQNTTQKFGD